MSEPDWAPLTGFRVAVTSARRADELSALLRRRGATVTSAAAITMVPLPDDDELRDAHRGADRRAARHRDRHHRHRLPRLGRRRRRLGTGQRTDRRARQGAHRVARTEGHRRAARGGPARGVVAGVGVVARAAALPASRAASPGSASPCSCTAPPTTGIRSPSSSTNCAPRAPKSCRSACTAGIRHRATATSTSWSRASPSEKFDAVSFTSAPAVAVDADARRGDGHRGPGADGAAHRGARDVRRPGDGAAAGPARCADVGAGADAAGRVGPSHHRRAAAAAVAHGPGGRTSAGDPRHLRAGRRRGQGALARRDGDHPGARAPPGRGGVAQSICWARCPAAAPTPTRSRRRYCGFERRWATRTSCRRSSSAATGWPSTTNWPTRYEPRAGRARHPQARRCRDDRRPRAAGVGGLGHRVHVAFVDVLGPTPTEVLPRCCDEPAVLVPAFLSRGYHVSADIPAHVAASGHPDVTVTDALGPGPQLARVLGRSACRIRLAAR